MSSSSNDHDLIQRARQQIELTRRMSVDTAPEVEPRVSTSLAGYKIQRELHRGSQGVVYEARQESTKRLVAIKMVREGPFSSRIEHARLQREVEILGRLKHAHIVTIHDSGTAGSGVFFVMDIIDGPALDEFLRERREACRSRADRKRFFRETLQLFAKICDAIHAAHLHGIIHRDLKPSNVRIDAAGEPHVLDFGLAKAVPLDSSSASMTLTEPGQFVGTMLYASPEQIHQEDTALDLRTDVYSLGLMMFAALTGSFPYKVKGPLHSAVETIVHQAPQRPRQIVPDIDGEIETIVLKCLSKDRWRRYQSAGSLSADLRAYLAGEAISAKRDSFGYLARNFVKRHRLTTALTAVILILTLVGFGVSLGFWRRAEVQRGIAENHALQSGAVSQFLQDMLESADPARTPGRAVTVEDVLDDAIANLDQGAFDDQPAVEAAVRHTIGVSYSALGQFDRARPQLEEALAQRQALFDGPTPETAGTLYALGVLYFQTNDYERAEESLGEALETRRNLLGHDDLDVAMTLHWIGRLRRNLGAPDEAIAMLGESVDILRNCPDASIAQTASLLQAYGSVLEWSGDVELAEPLLTEALALNDQYLGPDHPALAEANQSMAMLKVHRGLWAEALRYSERAVESLTQTLGEGHLDTLAARQKQALILHNLGHGERAERTLRELIPLLREALGPDNIRVRGAMSRHGQVLSELGRYAEAEDLQRTLVSHREQGGATFDDAASLANLALTLQHAKQYDEAEDAYLQALEALRRFESVQYAQQSLSALYGRIGFFYLDQFRSEEAEAAFLEALEIARQHYDERHHIIGGLYGGIGASLIGQQRFEESERWLLDSLERFEFMPRRYLIRKNYSYLFLSRLYGAWHEAEPDGGYDEKRVHWKAQYKQACEAAEESDSD